MIIKPNMNINIRTEEEYEIFTEVGEKEGIKWWCGGYRKLSDRRNSGIIGGGVYINKRFQALTSPLDHKENSETIVVEAADLFHNQLISRRLKDVT